MGQHEGIDYLVMEHLEGETLAQRLKQGPLPMEQVLELGGQIADALDKAHKSGVVHRDLKPGNIMLTAGGVKLLDFGLARQQISENQVKSGSFSRALTETPSSAPLTVEGTILGTFQYMPPEQIEGGEADARSDIFAFGAVLYEMATGRKAFEGKTQASLIGSVMHSKPEPVSKLVPLGPPAFDRVVETCLAKDPEDRFGTAHDVGLQLKWIAEGGSQVGLPAPIAARRKIRERLAWGLAAAAAIAAVTFAVLWARRAPGAAPGGPLRDPRARRAPGRGVAATLSRRALRGLPGNERRGPGRHLAQAAERPRRPAGGGLGGRPLAAVLVPGQPAHRVLCR